MRSTCASRTSFEMFKGRGLQPAFSQKMPEIQTETPLKERFVPRMEVRDIVFSMT